MTGRERVLAVLNRQSPDVIPFDLGGTECSSMHVITYDELRKQLSLPEKTVTCSCAMQLSALTDADVLDAMGIDTVTLDFASLNSKVWHSPFGLDVLVPEKMNIADKPDGSSVVTNAEGEITSKRAEGAYYFDPVGTPLACVSSAAELNGFDSLFERWDYPDIYDEPIEQFAARARELYNSTDRAVIGQWRLHYLQAGQIMRGYEQFLVDLMIDKGFAHAMLERLHEVYLGRVELFLENFGEHIDAVFLTDDLGTQDSCMISPAVYKEMIFPYIAEIVGKIKKRGLKVIMHSCGAVRDFIPLFIEMGVDALNPVQVSAAGMNPAELVSEFGDNIAFWGGGCDSQHALNAKDTEVVRADVRRRIEEFGDKASWVFTQVHNIQYDVPAANVLAMHDEFRKSRG